MIGIYVRQSIEKNGSVSVQSQLQLCRNLCGDNEKVQEYIDVGFSGKNMNRPALSKLMSEIKMHRIQTVMVYRLDRISRSIVDFSNMMELFQKYHVRFISCTEWFDTSSPMGRAMLSIAATFAQLERETISQRISDSYRTKSLKGEFMGGQIPLGYRLCQEEGKLTIDKEEAQVIQRIYELYLMEEHSYRSVCDELNHLGYQTKRKKMFMPARVGEILRNPCYVRNSCEVVTFLKEQDYQVLLPDGMIVGRGYYSYTKSAPVKVAVLAPHMGIIEGKQWIMAQEKRLCYNRTKAKP